MAFKVAVYTLTRDRLEYTKHCFKTLEEKAGYPYDHYIVDNGSTDSTQDWLMNNKDKYRTLFFPENKGISIGSNTALDMMLGKGYDLIIKMDNDCEIVSDGIIDRIVRIFKNKPPLLNVALSPRVNGITNQPTRSSKTLIDDCEIGFTSIIGGLFHCVPADIYQQYRYPLDLPLAWGNDDSFCEWFRQQGGQVGYIEPLIVNHYETTDGQAKRYPDYFERKNYEEKH